MDAPTQRLFGLRGLFAELAEQGVSIAQLLAGSGITTDQLSDPRSLISRRQRLIVYSNAQRLSGRPDVGIYAGKRQRMSDYGVFGYAMASCHTLGDALDLGLEQLPRATHAVPLGSRVEGDVGILFAQNAAFLGDALPFLSEFWCSSMNGLFCNILESPFPSIRMLVTYPAPSYWRTYEREFGCPIEFDAGVNEWHYDARLRNSVLPNANPVTMSILQSCWWDAPSIDGAREVDLVSTITAMLMDQSGDIENIDSIAGKLGMSLRTLHRRLAAAGVTYKSIVDEVRQKLAFRYLRQTTMTIEQIAEQTGFSDASNFRRAFKRWTGRTPGELRRLPEKKGLLARSELSTD
ncbi:AraC family transcriptional regulator [Paraburkholderia sacchari]|uniref:AraC family transcriptional regulator n=1 Tax=Paraburkholderia sacchari TaxID=159450 RepID=UPI001BCBD7AE|nr:AraC family transcriptional regulator [Paraburkholderia sacchari]